MGVVVECVRGCGMGVGGLVSIPESAQMGHNLLPSFLPLKSKSNWDSSTNSILLLGVLIGKAI